MNASRTQKLPKSENPENNVFGHIILSQAENFPRAHKNIGISENLPSLSCGRSPRPIRSAPPTKTSLALTLSARHLLAVMAGAGMDIKYVAHLARIALSPEEEEKLAAQLGNILGYIEKLNQLDVTNVEPTAHAIPLVNVSRPDEIHPSLSSEDALSNAPAKANGLFLVPKIVE